MATLAISYLTIVSSPIKVNIKVGVRLYLVCFKYIKTLYCRLVQVLLEMYI